MVAISSSALSMLPAVLLDLSLGNGFKWLRRAGCGLAATTMLVHTSELVWPIPERHELALRLTTIGFGATDLDRSSENAVCSFGAKKLDSTSGRDNVVVPIRALICAFRRAAFA